MAATARDFEGGPPSVLGPQTLQALNLRFRMIADRLSGRFATILRRPITLGLEQLEQIHLGDFTAGLPDRFCLLRLKIPDQGQPAFLCLDDDLVSRFIDLVLGGLGVGDATAPERPPSELEERLLDELLNPLIDLHREFLSSLAPIAFERAGFGRTLTEFQPLPEADPCVVARYSLSWGEERASLRFLLPLGSLAATLEQAAALPLRSDGVSAASRAALETGLADSKVDTWVELGEARLALKDVAGLELGDVLVLDRRVGTSFDLYVEGSLKQRGRLGRSGASLGFAVDPIDRSES